MSKHCGGRGERLFESSKERTLGVCDIAVRRHQWKVLLRQLPEQLLTCTMEARVALRIQSHRSRKGRWPSTIVLATTNHSGTDQALLKRERLSADGVHFFFASVDGL